MCDAIACPIAMWRSTLSLFATSNVREGSQGGVVSKNLLPGDTLHEASHKCIPNTPTCSFGILYHYVEAVRACLISHHDLEFSAIPFGGEIELRQPFQSTAPDTDELVCTLIDIIDMHPGHRLTMSISEFVSVLTHLNALVLPIVPQVTRSENLTALHISEEGIKYYVWRSPFFNPAMRVDDWVPQLPRQLELLWQWSKSLGMERLAAMLLVGKLWQTFDTGMLQPILLMMVLFQHFPGVTGWWDTVLRNGSNFVKAFRTVMQMEPGASDAGWMHRGQEITPHAILLIGSYVCLSGKWDDILSTGGQNTWTFGPKDTKGTKGVPQEVPEGGGSLLALLAQCFPSIETFLENLPTDMPSDMPKTEKQKVPAVP